MRLNKTKWIAALSVLLGLGACGEDSTRPLKEAVPVFVDYYATHPLTNGWKVKGIMPDFASGRLVVQVVVTSDADVSHIKSLSRMEQFSVAKIACPTMSPALQDAIGSKARVWVQLKTKKEVLTTSVCPLQ